MSVQQHYMKNLVELPLATLDKKLEKCRTGKADEDDPVILDIRELVVDFDHVPVILRRIYVDTPDAATLASVGWIVNENVDFCLECTTSFSFFMRKHHCRTCGTVACKVCCSAFASIKDFPELGTQRVCHRCNPLVSTFQRIFRPS